MKEPKIRKQAWATSIPIPPRKGYSNLPSWANSSHAETYYSLTKEEVMPELLRTKAYE